MWYDHPAIYSTTDIKLLLPQWGCTARTLLVVRWQKHAHCSSVAYPGNQREPGHAPKGFSGMDTMDNACIGAKSVRTHPLGKNTIKGCALREREHLNKPKQFSILRWCMGNMHICAYEKFGLFYSSKKCFPYSQYISYPALNRYNLKVIFIKINCDGT